MRRLSFALVLAASTLTASAAFATPPAAAPATTAARPQTPPNADKTIRPQTPPVKATPTVSLKTAALAEQHDQAAQNPKRPIPVQLRTAKQEVLERNQTIAQTREGFRSESSTIADRAQALAHPMATVRVNQGEEGARYKVNGTYVAEREQAASPEALAQASEAYVSAAQLLVKRSGGLSQRVARENPDQEAKVDSAKQMATDYKKGAALYRLSAEADDRRAASLTAAGKLPEANIARDKAHNTRFVADRIEQRAAAIEAGGVPGADAFTLPTEIDLTKP